MRADEHVIADVDRGVSDIGGPFNGALMAVCAIDGNKGSDVALGSDLDDTAFVIDLGKNPDHRPWPDLRVPIDKLQWVKARFASDSCKDKIAFARVPPGRKFDELAWFWHFL